MIRDGKDRINIVNIKKTLCAFTFGIMFAYLLMQFRNVMVYFDDYGYYSLSYGSVYPHSSTDFSFAELIDFLRLHYNKINGRVLWFFIWLLIYKIGDLALVQIVAASITTGVLVVVWKYTSKEETKVTSAICICALYGMLPIEIQQHGTYWLCPFFLYVAPILPLMIFLMMYIRYRKCGFSILQRFLMIGLVLLSAFSQEQLGVSVLSMMLLLLVWDIWEKRNSGFNYVLILTTLFCVAALVLNPGLQNRASVYDDPLIDRIIRSTELVIRMFFSKSMKPFIIALFSVVAAISFTLFKEDREILKWFDLFCAGYALCSIIVYCHQEIQNRIQLFFGEEIKMILVGVFVVCIIFVQVFRYYFSRKRFDRLILFMTAVASVGCLCFVPELPFRLFIPSWLLLFPLLTDGMTTCIDLLRNEKTKVIFSVMFCVVISFFSIQNSSEIYQGYENNFIVHQYNDTAMRDFAAQEKSGSEAEQIYLKELPDARYSGVMVYDLYERGPMKKWMMSYYGIVSNPDLYFSTDGKPVASSDEFYAELGNGVYRKVKAITIEKIHPMYSEEGTLTLAVECDPIYRDCQIEVNGTVYPTTVGDTFISAVITEAEMPLSVSVVVPYMNHRSDYVVIE